MKSLYTFVINKEEEKEEVVIKTDSAGKELKVIEKVKKQIPHTFILKKPSRSLFDEAECIYAQKVSEYVRKGVLPAIQLEKRYMNDGGILSEEQKREMEVLYKLLFQKNTEYGELLRKRENGTITPEETARVTNIFNELVTLMNDVQNVESRKESLYNYTAESLARNQTILWWALNISYEQNDNNYTPFFGNGKYEEKLALYDAIEEGDDTYKYEITKRFMLATSLWFMGKAEKQEDFDLLINQNEEKENEEPVEEGAKPPVEPVATKIDPATQPSQNVNAEVN